MTFGLPLKLLVFITILFMQSIYFVKLLYFIFLLAEVAIEEEEKNKRNVSVQKYMIFGG